MARLTKKTLMAKVNELLERVELGFICVRIDRSRFRGQDYECGAWHWAASLRRKNNPEEDINLTVYSYVPFADFQIVIDGKAKLIFSNTYKARLGGVGMLDITYKEI